MATSQNGHDYLRIRLFMGFRSVICHSISSAWQKTKRACAVLCVVDVGIIVQDSINVYMSGQSQALLAVAFLLGNPLLAVVYPSMPYAIMLTIDIRARRKDKKRRAIGQDRHNVLGTLQSSRIRSYRGRSERDRRIHLKRVPRTRRISQGKPMHRAI